jgi:hypothetical protein
MTGVWLKSPALQSQLAKERKYRVNSTGVLKRFYNRATISEAPAPPVRNMARQRLATVPLPSAASALCEQVTSIESTKL